MSPPGSSTISRSCAIRSKRLPHAFSTMSNTGKKYELVFEDWIAREWTRNSQTKAIAGTADATEAIRVLKSKGIFVGLMEHFDESMVMLRALRAPDLDISYKRVNVGTSDSIASRLLSDGRTNQLLVEATRVDQELYDHVAQELYPEFRGHYGSSQQQDVARFRADSWPQFNRRNIALYRVKQHGVYRPLVRLYRLRSTRFVATRLLR